MPPNPIFTRSQPAPPHSTPSSPSLSLASTSNSASTNNPAPSLMSNGSSMTSFRRERLLKRAALRAQAQSGIRNNGQSFGDEISESLSNPNLDLHLPSSSPKTNPLPSSSLGLESSVEISQSELLELSEEYVPPADELDDIEAEREMLRLEAREEKEGKKLSGRLGFGRKSESAGAGGGLLGIGSGGKFRRKKSTGRLDTNGNGNGNGNTNGLSPLGILSSSNYPGYSLSRRTSTSSNSSPHSSNLSFHKQTNIPTSTSFSSLPNPNPTNLHTPPSSIKKPVKSILKKPGTTTLTSNISNNHNLGAGGGGGGWNTEPDLRRYVTNSTVQSWESRDTEDDGIGGEMKREGMGVGSGIGTAMDSKSVMPSLGKMKGDGGAIGLGISSSLQTQSLPQSQSIVSPISTTFEFDSQSIVPPPSSFIINSRSPTPAPAPPSSTTITNSTPTPNPNTITYLKLVLPFPNSHPPSPSGMVSFPSTLEEVMDDVVHGSVGEVMMFGGGGGGAGAGAGDGQNGYHERDVLDGLMIVPGMEIYRRPAAGKEVKNNSSETDPPRWNKVLLLLCMKKTTLILDRGARAGRTVKQLNAYLHIFPLNSGGMDQIDVESWRGKGGAGRKDGKKLTDLERVEMLRMDVTSSTVLSPRNGSESDGEKTTLVIGSGGHEPNEPTGNETTSPELWIQLSNGADRSEWSLQLSTIIAELSSESPALAHAQLRDSQDDIGSSRIRKVSDGGIRRDSLPPRGEAPTGPLPAPPQPTSYPMQGSNTASPITPTRSFPLESPLMGNYQAPTSPGSISRIRPTIIIPPGTPSERGSIEWDVPISVMVQNAPRPPTKSIQYTDPIDGKTYDLPPSILATFMANDQLKSLLASGAAGTPSMTSTPISSTTGGSSDSEALTPVASIRPPLASPVMTSPPLSISGSSIDDSVFFNPPTDVNITPRYSITALTSAPQNSISPTHTRIPTSSTSTTITPTILSPSHSAATLSSTHSTTILTPDPSRSEYARSPSFTGSEGGSIGSESTGGDSRTKRAAWRERVKRMKEGGMVKGAGGLENELDILNEAEAADPWQGGPEQVKPTQQSMASESQRRTVVRFAN